MKRQREQEIDLQQFQEHDEKELKTGRLLPKKADYRMRAHINPLNASTFPFPQHHTYVDWRAHYPKALGIKNEEQNYKVCCNTVQHPSNYEEPRSYALEKQVSIIDVGCGFGGLLFGLALEFPQKMILGMEIRDKLVNYVGEKIRGMRMSEKDKYDNISVVRTNTMRHLCQYFPKGSLDKIFICFPDPHFKAKNYRRRVINTGFLSEYAFLLKTGGKLYCITDVLELHQWHLEHLRSHLMFKEIKDADDPCIKIMRNKTEQGQKVERNQGDKFWAIFQRV